MALRTRRRSGSSSCSMRTLASSVSSLSKSTRKVRCPSAALDDGAADDEADDEALDDEALDDEALDDAPDDATLAPGARSRATSLAMGTSMRAPAAGSTDAAAC